LRFDFTGNGHSTGIFHHSNYNREFHDLQTVLSFVRDQMKCRVACVIGHSKGVGAVLRTAEEQESHAALDSSFSRRTRIPCFVNMSGIFAVPHEYDIEKRLGVEKARVLKQNGRVVLDQKGARECVMTIHEAAWTLLLSRISKVRQSSQFMVPRMKLSLSAMRMNLQRLLQDMNF
jgi:hypothetical protein